MKTYPVDCFTKDKIVVQVCMDGSVLLTRGKDEEIPFFNLQEAEDWLVKTYGEKTCCYL